MAGGFIGQWLLEGRKQEFEKEKQEYERQKEAKRKKAEKLEELVSLLYEHMNVFRNNVNNPNFDADVDAQNKIALLYAKIDAILTVYFSQYTMTFAQISAIDTKKLEGMQTYFKRVFEFLRELGVTRSVSFNKTKREGRHCVSLCMCLFV